MIKDVTLGQFFPGKSPLHKADPRTKLILSIILITALFMAKNFISFALIAFLTAALVLVSRISARTILRGIKPIIYILVFTFVLNIFWTKGEGEPLFSWRIITVYKSGIIYAFFMSLRIILLIISTTLLMSYTTSPIVLTDGLEQLLMPLKKIKVPVHEFSMMMTIALRFIPTLIEETDKIMNAQKSRGADFAGGSLIKRAKALIPVLVPLFVSAFKRADELALAMICRCYHGGEGRTKMTKLSYAARDIVLLLTGAAALAGVVLLNRFVSGLTI